MCHMNNHMKRNVKKHQNDRNTQSPGNRPEFKSKNGFLRGSRFAFTPVANYASERYTLAGISPRPPPRKSRGYPQDRPESPKIW